MTYFSKGIGDPDQRKLARRASGQFEEAASIASILAGALRDCGQDFEAIRSLAKDLRQESVRQMEIAESGRVESRLAMPRSGSHPLKQNRPICLLHLDESGTSSTNSPEDVFALGGIAMKEEDKESYVNRADELKRKYFGNTDITFHEPHMRKGRAIFNFRGDRLKQSAFNNDLNELLDQTPFVVLGAAIRKSEFKSRFIDTERDPYLPKTVYDLAIMLLMERFIDYLAYAPEKRLGRVHLESIGPKEDAMHQASYSSLMVHGTQYVSENCFGDCIEAGCHFAPKSNSSPTEIADIVAREIYEWVTSGCSKDPARWHIVSPRIYLRGDGHFGRFGLKVFPEAGLEGPIYAHRELCGAVPRPVEGI